MTLKEAKIVINIMLSADGGCSACAASLIQSFLENYPELESLAKTLWEEEFDAPFEGLNYWRKCRERVCET